MKGFGFLKRLPFHPLLWASYPPLALLGHNIAEVTPGSALRSILIALGMVLVLLFTLRIVFGNWLKAAFVTSVLVALFFAYGHIYGLVEDRQFLGVNFGRHRFLLLLNAGLLALVLVFTLLRREWQGITQALNLIGLFLLVFPLWQIVSYEVTAYAGRRESPGSSLMQQVANLQVSPGKTPPDVYYIILDSYARADTLNRTFAFDNSDFLDSLKDKGFFVADCSMSNYAFTSLSLASSLNLSYKEALSDQFTGTRKGFEDVYPYVWNNVVRRALKDLGYKIVAFETGYSPTEWSDAEVYYSQNTDLRWMLLVDGVNPFESMLLNTSAGMFIYELSPNLSERVPITPALESAYVVYRNRILYTLNRLELAPDLAGPKFVFAHIMAPHTPFVFGANGEYVKRRTPFTLNQDEDVYVFKDYVAGYNAELSYLNSRVLQLVDQLLERSAVPPVIILQSDHGIPRLNVPRLKGQRNAILNAYYLPDGGNEALYAAITPVNTFRVVFNQYFDGHLELLDDLSCEANPKEAPFLCTSVVDTRQVCPATPSP